MERTMKKLFLTLVILLIPFTILPQFKNPENEKKVDPLILKELRIIDSELDKGKILNKDLAKDNNIKWLRVNDNGRILVSVRFKTINVKSSLIDLGCEIKTEGKYILYVWVPYEKLENVVELEDVTRVRSIGTGTTWSVTSEGFQLHKGDLAQTNYGAYGEGIKVGVISDGIDERQASYENGDLPHPQDIIILDYGQEDGTEGTAMMEIIYDFAPQAIYYFAGIEFGVDGPLDMANNILNLTAQGCKVIVDDLGWLEGYSYFEEKEIYSDLLQRKPGQGELSSPRREPDIPVIYSGVNAADTMTGFKNEGYTNGTPLVILIPNMDRHFEHVEQYRTTNRTPRPGHASYASYQKYGQWDDSIGAGIFSGRYTSTIVAAGFVAKRILKDHGIDIFSYVKEAAGISMPEIDYDTIKSRVESFKEFRRNNDPIYNLVFKEERIKPGMRFFEKMAVLTEIEKKIPGIKPRQLSDNEISELAEKGLHPVLNCPDLESAKAMHEKILAIRDDGDSSGGIVEVVARGIPAGVGEPVFSKLDGELGRMMSIGTVKAVEVGAGMQVKDMTGSECNDQMYIKDGKVAFDKNNSGGITGGLTTGQDIIVRLAIKPTPTIARDQRTIDKVSLTDSKLAAVTRRDPTIVSRVWPVAEAFTAIILLDQFILNLAYQEMNKKYS